MMKVEPFVLTYVFTLTLVQSSYSQDTPCICLQDVVPENELRTTVRMKPFPDGTGRILMAEKIGVLWIYSENFTRQPEPFANISHLIVPDYLDMGLQGVAIHPNFPQDGRIFVNFNQREENGDYGTLRQYSVFPDNPDMIDLDTEVILIDRHRETNGESKHSGGEVFFNNDGYLYVTYGDGSQGDPLYVAQNRSDFRGKILRLDVDNVPEGQAYGIPPDNPFIGEEGTLPEIYALGFRQPWTVSVDSGDPETGADAGRMFLADCGQRSYEEIDLVVKGGNYGWSSREGPACYKYRHCGNIGAEEMPIASYHHTGYSEGFGQCAIGGHFYRGDLNPGLRRAYIHGDTGLWTTFMASFGRDSYGEVYLVSSTTWDVGFGSRIQRLVDPATYAP